LRGGLASADDQPARVVHTDQHWRHLRPSILVIGGEDGAPMAPDEVPGSVDVHGRTLPAGRRPPSARTLAWLGLHRMATGRAAGRAGTVRCRRARPRRTT